MSDQKPDTQKTKTPKTKAEKALHYFILKDCDQGRRGRVVKLLPSVAAGLGDKVRKAKRQEVAIAGER